MNWLMTLLALLGGVGIAVQAGVNGELGKKIGSIEGAFVSFLVGTVVLLIMMLFFGKGNILSLFSLPKWQLTGGLIGAAYVFIMVLTVPHIGVASALIAVVCGQILMSTVIDHFGFITGNPIPVDWKRMVALVLLGVALYLFYKR